MSVGLTSSSRRALAIVVTLAATFAARGANPVETDAATSLLPGSASRQGLALIDSGAQTGPAPLLPAVDSPAPLGDPPSAPTIDVGPGGSDLWLYGTATMPGGTYDCLTFFVDRYASITFTGPTTIRATSWATVNGRVQTTSDDAPLTIVSGGTMTVGSYQKSYGSDAVVATEGLRSDVTLECAAAIGLSYFRQPYFHLPRVYAAQSSLHVRAGALHLVPMGLSAGIDIDVVTTGGIDSHGLYISYESGGESLGGVVLNAGRDIALRTATGPVSFWAGETKCGGRLTIEGGEAVGLDSGVARFSADGGMDVTAYGGRILLSNGASIVAAATGALGTSTLRARDGVSVTGAAWPSSITSGSDRLVIESTAGDVIVGDEGATTGNDVYPAGVLELRVGGAVRVRDGARVGAARGATVAATGELSVGAGAALDGGDGALVAESLVSMTFAADARANGGSVTLRAPGALSIAAGAHVESTVGDVVLVGGPTTLAGAAVTSQGSVRATSLSGTADVRDATLSSRDLPTSFVSGSVQVVAFGASATILAQGATLRSGAAAVVSGDLILRVVADPAPGVAPPVFIPPPGTPRVDPPYVVPSTVTLKSRRGAAMQYLELHGFVDLGLAGPVVPGNAIVTVDDAPLAADLAATKRGTGVARGADVVVLLGAAKPGSARRPLTLRARGTFLPERLTGEFAIRVTLPGVSAACRVRLDAGRFDARHGALVAPTLFVADVRAVRDGVRLTLGVPAEELATSVAPDVELYLADGVRHVAPGDFAPTRGGRLVATAPTTGVARMTVDPAARTIAADVALDALGVAATGGALDVALRINGRGVGVLRVVVGRSGTRVVD